MGIHHAHSLAVNAKMVLGVAQDSIRRTSSPKVRGTKKTCVNEPVKIREVTSRRTSEKDAVVWLFYKGCNIGELFCLRSREIPQNIKGSQGETTGHLDFASKHLTPELLHLLHRDVLRMREKSCDPVRVKRFV